MKIKTGDNVKVLTGKDRGKTGKIIQVLRDKAKGKTYVVVEGLNIRKKHLRSRDRKEKGRTIELSAPMHVSNVAVLDPKTNTPTRVGFKVEGPAKKRVAKKSGEYID